jgi:dienelactone hydrolase
VAEVVLFHHAQDIGFPNEVIKRGAQAVAGLPTDLEGDIDAARELVAEAEDGELFLYPGDRHYFADSSLPSFDSDATALRTQRMLALLAGC